MKIVIHYLFSFVFFTLFCVRVQAQDCLTTYFESNEDGGDLVVQLKVENFQNIMGFQFAFTYTYGNIELISIQGNDDIGLTSTNIFSEVPGFVSVSWSNASTGQTLPDGSTLFEMRFNVLITDYTEFSIDPNFLIEIFDGNFQDVCFQSTPSVVNESRTLLTGKLFHDLNGNCLGDPSDLPLKGWTVLINAGLVQYYRVTDAFGYYNIPVEIGTYTIQVIDENDLWTSCDDPAVVTVGASGEIIENSFVLSPSISSSALEVNISSSEIRRCFNAVYAVNYKNNGTAVAQSSTIEVRIDENLEYVTSSMGGISIDGNVLAFDLGNVKPGEGGSFRIVLKASCDNIEAGQTLCVEAHISSDDIVIPPINWGGAVLTTEASCEGDSVAFAIQNIGSAPMDIPLQFIVVEDDVMFGTNEVDLEPLELMKFKYRANGGVYRVLIDQEEGYPLGNFSTDFVEFCNGGDKETYQYISMFQIEDESPYVDIECQEVKENEEFNVMSTFPVGYRDEHFINQNEDIEYTIYFQNVGTDTVNNLYIGSNINEFLDAESIIAGPSSHNYTFSIKEERRLIFTFNNIQLPDVTSGETRSKGFIKYRISQKKDVPVGTKINSQSILIFDLQDVVETNVITHTIGEEFIEIVLSNEDLLSDRELVVAPNPALSNIRVEIPAEFKDVSYVLYDTNGRVVNAANTPSNIFYIHRDFIQEGMYFLEIRSSSTPLGTKKIVFYDE